MRYLITGGAGFIGSHLAEELIRRRHSVTVIDDLSTGSINNIRHLRWEPQFTCVIDTVMNKPLLAELVDEADIIVHFAAAVGVRLIVQSPVRTIETNVSATELLLELAAKKHKKVVIASTSEVYGKAPKVPFSEDDDIVIGPPHKGRWSYACSKAIDEFLALAYWREKSLPAVVVRFFNTIGPRQTGQYGMVVPTLVRQALSGDALTVYGDGEQSRCFGWVGDAVRATIELAEHPAAIGQVFNIGNDEETTINQLAQIVVEVVGSRSEITHIPYDEAYEPGFEDMPRRIPDLRKVGELIGFRPTKTLRDILAIIVASMRSSIPSERVPNLTATTSAGMPLY